MATKSFEELNTGALTIKNNELPESNTHTLVGGHLVDMVAKEQEIDGQVAHLRSDLNGIFDAFIENSFVKTSSIYLDSTAFTRIGCYSTISNDFVATENYRSTESYDVKNIQEIILYNSYGSSLTYNVMFKSSGVVLTNQSISNKQGGISIEVPTTADEVMFSTSVESYMNIEVMMFEKGSKSNLTFIDNMLGISSDIVSTYTRNGCYLVSTGVFADTISYKSSPIYPVSAGDVIRYKKFRGSASVYNVSLFESLDGTVNSELSIKGNNVNLSGEIIIPKGVQFVSFTTETELSQISSFSIFPSLYNLDKEHVKDNGLGDKKYNLFGSFAQNFPKNEAFRSNDGVKESDRTLYASSHCIVVTEGLRFAYKLSASESYNIISAYTDDRNPVAIKELSIAGKGAFNPISGIYTVPNGVKYISFTTTTSEDTRQGRYFTKLEYTNPRKLWEGIKSPTYIYNTLTDCYKGVGTVTNPDGTATVHAEGIGGGLGLAPNTVEYYFNLTSKISIPTGDSSGDFFLVFGKYDTESGTMIGVRKEGSSFTFNVYAVKSTGGVQTIYSLPIPAITLNKPFRLTMEKFRDYAIFTLSYDDKEYPIEVFGENFGSCWGKPTLYMVQGKCVVYDFYFSPQRNKDAKVLVFGDSYTEGSSLRFCKDALYAELLAKDIGRFDLINLGRGGDFTERIKMRFEAQLNMYPNAKYAVLNYGVNDVNVETYKTNLTEQIALVKSKGIIPVLCTIPMRYDKGNIDKTNIINPWVKNRGELYVDVYESLINAQGNVNPEWMLLDNIHPTVEGHRRIYNRFKLDAPYLF